jgi:hypothetical protein
MEWDGEQVFIASVDLAALPGRSRDTELSREGRVLFLAETFDGRTTLDWPDGPPEFPYALYIPPGTETVARDPSSAGDCFHEEYVLERRPLGAETIWDMDTTLDPDGFSRSPADMDAGERESYEEAVALKEAIEEFRSLAGQLSP